MTESLELKGVVVTKTLTIRMTFGYCGWATFYVDDASGILVVESDWGTYSYGWGRGPWLSVDPPDLSRALLHFGRDYVATKLYGGDQHVYDSIATERAWRKTVTNGRRLRELTRDQARDAWNALDYLEFGHEVALVESCRGLDELEFIHAGEPWTCLEHKPAPRYVILRDELIPFFVQELRKALDAASVAESTGTE